MKRPFTNSLSEMAAVEKNNKSIIVALICITAFLFSTLLSGIGLSLSLKELDLPLFIVLAGSTLGTSMLSGVAYLAWKQAGNLVGKWLRYILSMWCLPLALIVASIGAIATTASIFTSFSASVFVFQEERIQKELRARQTSTVTAPIRKFSAAFLNVASGAENVQKSAQTASDIETSDGGTCTNTTQGTGPIQRHRLLHSTQASTFATASRELANQSKGMLTKMSKVATQEEVDTIFRQAHQLQNNQSIRSIRNWAKKTAHSLSGNPVSIEGRTRVCQDLEMADQLEYLITTLDDLPKLPEIAPQISKGNVFDTMFLNYEIIKRIGLGSDLETSDYSVMPFLFFSATIDLIGLVSAFLMGMQSGRQMTKTEKLHALQLDWGLQHFMWPLDDNRTYFLYPCGSQDPRKERIARNILHELGLGADIPTAKRIPLSLLKTEVPDLPAYYEQMASNPKAVDLYHLSDAQERLMRRLQAALHIKLLNEEIFYSDLPSEYHASNVIPNGNSQPVRLATSGGSFL
jgi:hypothetical protein